MGKTRVIIIDDSALVRRLLKDILDSDPEIEVVAVAVDAYDARKKIKKYNPDVITLDVEMPKMDGITFLRNLMRLRPMPVIMVSTLTENGADVTMQALALGAVDFVAKPKIDITHSIDEYAEEIIAKVKVARHANVKTYKDDKNKSIVLRSASKIESAHSVDEVLPQHKTQPNFRTTEQIIAIGASTGGTEAVREVIQGLPASFPGTVITQHIPAGFSAAFAERVNATSAMEVHEAKDGQQIMRGHAYVAPGDHHLLVVRDGAIFRCKINQEVPVNRHRPSVDVLFRSVAQNLGRNAMGVILTGMGKDGAVGLKEMQEAGAKTIAQDEQTSVVWGMPGEAVKLGGVDNVLPLNEIAETLLELNSLREKEVNSNASKNLNSALG